MPPRLSSIPCSSSLHFRKHPPPPPLLSHRMRNRPRRWGSGSLSARAARPLPPTSSQKRGSPTDHNVRPYRERAGGHLWFAGIEMHVLWGSSGSRRAAALPAFTATRPGSARSWNFQAGHHCNPDKNGASILEAESAVWEGLASVPSTAATSVYGHRFLWRVAELVS